MACFFVPLTALSLSDLAPREVASGAGLSNFTRILAGSFGTSLSVTLWDRRGSLHYSQLVEHINNANPLTQQALDQMKSLAGSTGAGLDMLSRVITKQAVMLATDDIFWISGCIFLALIAVLWFARPAHAAGTPGGAH